MWSPLGCTAPLASHCPQIQIQISHHDHQGPVWSDICQPFWSPRGLHYVWLACFRHAGLSVPVMPTHGLRPGYAPAYHVLSWELDLLDPSTIHTVASADVIFSRGLLWPLLLKQLCLPPQQHSTPLPYFIFLRTLHQYRKSFVNLFLFSVSLCISSWLQFKLQERRDTIYLILFFISSAQHCAWHIANIQYLMNTWIEKYRNIEKWKVWGCLNG